MKIDTDRLKTEVKPQITALRNWIEYGKTEITNMVIPSDFTYREKLKNIKQSLSDIDRSVANVESWLDTVIEDFSNAEDNNNDILTWIFGDIGDYLATAGASVGNATLGAGKGVGKAGENLVDVLAMAGTLGATPFTYIADKIAGTSTTNSMWGNTMSFVAKDHVESAYNYLYNTNAGQWLDDKSIGIFKSDGIGTNVLSGVGEVAGTVGISILTGGAAAATRSYCIFCSYGICNCRNIRIW